MELNESRQIEELMLKYEFALEMLQTQLNILIKEYEFINKYDPVEHIKARLKTKASAIEKLEKKGYEVNTDNLIKHVHDMIGVRIVCSFLSDVYDIVEAIKKSNSFVIKEEKNYIETPKDTGYISYHMIVLVPIKLNGKEEFVDAEIQIRTIAMDFWASLDHKMQYKFPSDIPDDVKQELYNCSLDIKALDTKMNQLNEFIKKYHTNNE